MKKITNIGYWIILAFTLILAGISVASALELPGSLKFLTVKSGSMSPAMPLGSFILVKPSSFYKTGDVITFFDPGGNDFYVTHRIAEETEQGFVTKGDANEDEDTDLVSSDLVVGKVMFIVPYLGYPIAFTKTREGLILLLIIPATLIVMGEISNIVYEIKQITLKRKDTARV